MMLADLPDLRLWRSPENLAHAARYLIAIAGEHEDADLPSLIHDPIATLEACAHIAVRWVGDTGSECALYGYYRSSPPTISLHMSHSGARDNFTVLHEYAHHLQQHDKKWAFEVLAKLPPFDAKLIEEAVCDAFASSVLMPDELVDENLGSRLTSKFIAQLFGKSSASRQAACMRAVEVAPAGEQYLVLLADPNGKIQFGRSTSEELPTVPFGSVQDDIARLATEALARGGQATGLTRTGLRYSTGNARSDLTIDISIDDLHVFAVVSPIYKFGEQNWGEDERECASASCGEVFGWTADLTCKGCSGPKCPVCSTCFCEKAAATTCSQCFTELSLAESIAGRTDHIECPF